MTVSRRALLVAGAASAFGTALAACSAPDVPSGSTRASSAPVSGTAPTPTRERTPSAPSAPSATSSPDVSAGPGAPVPTQAQIEARYAGRLPTAWGLNIPGVVTRTADAGPTLALTFDACGGRGGSGYDAALVDLLRAEQAKATLFLNRRWVAAHPAEFRDLAADPLFDIANHGTRHAPLSVTGRAAYGIRGTRSPGEAYTEVVENALDLQHRLGRPVTLFRPGTAYYDDVAVHIVRDLAMTPVGFDVNADGGATFAPRQVEFALRGVRPGSVVIAHMNQPHHGTAAGLRAALPRLRAAGYGFVHLRDHIRP